MRKSRASKSPELYQEGIEPAPGPQTRQKKQRKAKSETNPYPTGTPVDNGLGLMTHPIGFINDMYFSSSKHIDIFASWHDIDVSGQSPGDYAYTCFFDQVFPAYDAAFRRQVRFNAGFDSTKLPLHINAIFGLARFYYTTLGLMNLAATTPDHSSNVLMQLWTDPQVEAALLKARNTLATLGLPPKIHDLAYHLSMPFIFPDPAQTWRVFFAKGYRVDTAANLAACIEAQLYNTTRDDVTQLYESAKLIELGKAIGQDWRCTPRPPTVNSIDSVWGRFCANLWVNRPTFIMTDAGTTYDGWPSVGGLNVATTYRSIDDRFTAYDSAFFAIYDSSGSSLWWSGLQTPEDGFTGDRQNDIVYFNPPTNGWQNVNDGYEAVLSYARKPYYNWTYEVAPRTVWYETTIQSQEVIMPNVMDDLFGVPSLAGLMRRKS
jgi:hypothetical protein